MDQQPVSAGTPPAGAPARQRIPRWLIIAGGIVLGLGCLVLLAPLFRDSFERINLAVACMRNNPEADSGACNSDWAWGVQAYPEYRTCRDQAMSGTGINYDALYECLVEQGMGPE